MVANQVIYIYVVFVSIHLTAGNASVLNTTLLYYDNGTTAATQEDTPSQGTEDVVSIDPEKAEPKIVGGQAAEQGQFPYQVSLRKKAWSPTHFCGGSIIDIKHVVTAGHCVYGKGPGDILVVAGDVMMDRSSCTSVRRSVSDIFLHEGYNPHTQENDVAIIRVSEEFPTDNENIMAINLVKYRVDDNTTCQVSGWGALHESDINLPNRMQYVEVPIVSFSVCNRDYNYTLFSGMICAGLAEGSKDSCQGDSGGPLQCGGNLTGIVSWGIGCARPNYPGVYTNVYSYNTWIAEAKTRPSSAAITRGYYIYILALLGLLASTS